MSDPRLQNFEAAANWLNHELPKLSNHIFKGEAGFKRSQALMASLGNPQDAHPTWHVAGTAGKGSTAMMLSSLLVAHGQRVGLLMSPHVYDLRERIQIDNQPIPKEVFMQTLAKLVPVIDKLIAAGRAPSYFEVITAIGWVYCSNQDLDWMVVETGVGGLLDTTNTITRSDKRSLITRIDLDHQAVLGSTLGEIGAQKAGIIQRGQVALTVPQAAEAMQALRARADAMGAELIVVDEPSGVDPGKFNQQLGGEGQRLNAGLALEALAASAQAGDWKVEQAKVESALRDLRMPGRFEVVRFDNATVVFDGAHNPVKMTNLAEQLAMTFSKPILGVAAVGNGRDAQAVLAPLRPVVEQLIITGFSATQDVGVTAWVPEDDEYEPNHERLAQRILETGGVWVVTGSFYLLAEVRQALEAAQSAHA